MAYKKLIKVSNVCQLLDKSKYPATTTKEGITWTNNGDGTITANGTATAFTNILVDVVAPTIIKSGHKFLMLGCPLSNGNITTSKEYWMQEGYELCSDYGVGGFFSLKGNNINLRVYIQKDYTANNLVFKPQLFDLTEMYGAGHEPTSVEQFRQDFPEEMYDYSPYCWLTSYKRVFMTGGGNYLTSYERNLTCKTKNLFPYPYFETTRTRTGITFTDNGDGSITVNGTATHNTPFYLFESSTSLMGLKAGSTYTISMKGSTASCYLVVNYYSDGSWHSGRFDSFHPDFFTKTIPSTWEGFQCYILVVPGATINNAVFKPMIELGDTATDYVPYGHL